MESSGDPWLENPGSNAASRPYFLYAYFLTVTMSTVGYGDVLVTTASGQFLITVFIFIYLVRPPPLLPCPSLGSITSGPVSPTVSSTGYVCKLHTTDDGDPSKQEALHRGILHRLGEIVSHLSVYRSSLPLKGALQILMLRRPSLFLCLSFTN